MSDWVVRMIEQSGYLGVGFLMFLETLFPPIPSEVIMPVAGMAAAKGKMSYPLAVAAGTAGAMLGNIVWYLAARALAREEGLRERLRTLVEGRRGQVLRLHRLAPRGADVGERHAELARERALHSNRGRVPQDLADRGVAPALADILPQRFTEAVREILVRTVGHLLHRRDVARDCRITQPAGGERVVRADREILRHAFHEPQRRIDPLEHLLVRSGAAAREHIVLELVHHFVRKHVLKTSEIAGEGKYQAMTRRFSYTARSFAKVAGDVVLAEVGAR